VPHEIFVSYSQPDRDCALEIVTRIEGCGLHCWVAPRDITPAADWAAEIIDAISNAHLMVLIFSASSNDSPQVRREVERAVHRQLRILPFRIEDVLPCKSLEYFLSSQHWLDAFPPPREPHYARLCSYLCTALALPPQVLAARATGFASTSKESPAAGPVFATALLKGLEAELATCIGPIARHLVTHAATRAASAEELQTRLAAELDSESDRARFLEACRRLRQSRE